MWLPAATAELRKRIQPDSSLNIPHLLALTHEPRLHTVAMRLLPHVFDAFPIKLSSKHKATFADVLFGLIRFNPDAVHGLIKKRLAKKSIDTWQKAYLIMAGLWVDPSVYVSHLRTLLDSPRLSREPYLGFVAYNFRYGHRDSKVVPQTPWSMEVLTLLFRLFAPLCPANLPNGVHRSTTSDAGRDFLDNVSAQFLNNVSEEGLAELVNLCEDDTLSQWHQHLNDQRIKYTQALSEQNHTIPSSLQIASTLNNKTPANHADLMALAMDALAELQKSVNNSDTNLIHRFWGVDRYGKHPEQPHKAEPECRNVIVDDLRARLSNQGVSVSPETQHGGQNQSDITLLVQSTGHPDLLLPIEVKGDWNRELWTAPKEQLAKKYSSDPRCKNTGIYLVLWTADKKFKTPTGEIIDSPESLKEHLQILSDDIEGFDIQNFVLDIQIKK
jgi:hypothetical protein